MTSTTMTTHLNNPLSDPVNEFFASTQFPQALSNLINQYIMQRPDCFGGAEFRKFFGVDVGNPGLPYDEFVSWWNDVDPVDFAKNVENPKMRWETHLGPIYRPSTIREKSSDTEQAYNLELLAKFAAKPQDGGHPMTFCQEGEAFRQLARTVAGHGCWLVFRKGVVGRDLSYTEVKEYISRLNRDSGAEYEIDNTLLDLATVGAVRHVFKRERHFGDSTGMEGRLTFARSLDMVQLIKHSYPSALGGFDSSSRMTVDHRYTIGNEVVGVAAIRKFKPTWV